MRPSKSPGGPGAKREVGEGVFRLLPTGLRRSLGGRQGTEWARVCPAPIPFLRAAGDQTRCDPDAVAPRRWPLNRLLPAWNVLKGDQRVIGSWDTSNAANGARLLPARFCLTPTPDRRTAQGGRDDGQDHSKRQRQRALETRSGVAMKAAIYARVSTSNGSQTCENQLLELRRYCDANGPSGLTAQNRAALRPDPACAPPHTLTRFPSGATINNPQYNYISLESVETPIRPVVRGGCSTSNAGVKHGQQIPLDHNRFSSVPGIRWSIPRRAVPRTTSVLFRRPQRSKSSWS